MVTNDLNNAIRSLQQCNNRVHILYLQMNELLNDIDDHLNNPDDYCEECGELYDDCVCEEDDYMDDDCFECGGDPEICGCWDDNDNPGCNGYGTEVVTPPLNAFARARILNENY